MNKKIQTNLTNGRAVIPKVFRQALNIQDGDQIIWLIRDGELIATTLEIQLKKIQDLVAAHIPANAPSIVDELIADRRREAAQDSL